MRTVTDHIEYISEKLIPLYQEEPVRHHIAWWILETVTQAPRAQLIANELLELSQQQKNYLDNMLHEHVQNYKPLQYLIGSVPFGNLTLYLEVPVLIPRPETEEWCLKLLKKLQQAPHTNPTILDLGTGSGCIALALAQGLPQALVYATDISEHALALAQKNAEKNNLTNIKFIQSDVFESIPNDLAFDIIVTNPPYISPEEWKTIDPLVKKWEDQQALVASDQGLDIIKKIIQYAPAYIKKDNCYIINGIPHLTIEIGYQQGNHVKELMRNGGFKQVAIEKDFDGNDRIVTGRIE